ncbi:MAG: hypothetical protein WDN04_24995 [Rhodospirillales bacterium]
MPPMVRRARIAAEQRHLQRGGHRCRDFRLYIQDVARITVEGAGPYLVARCAR